MNYRKLVGIAAVVSSILLAGPANAEETRINLNLVTGVLNGLFQGTYLRLNNHGRRHGASWHVQDGSVLALGSRLGEHKVYFDIPEYRKKAGRRRYLYYVDDVRLRDIGVGQEGASLRIRLSFEEGGNEIKGHCLIKRLRKHRKCLAGSDKGAPDVEWQRPSIDVLLEPRAFNGSVSFGRVAVRVNGRFQAQGVCNTRIGDICDMMLRYKRQIRAAVTDAVQRQLARDSVRRQVAQVFSKALGSRGIGRIRRIQILGGNLVVDHS